MTRTQKLLVAVVLAALCAGAVYVFRQLEWEKVTRPARMSGEALRNPFHAGTELMRQLGYPASRITDMARLKALPADATLLLGEPHAFREAEFQRLMSWVRRGGHLVVPLSPAMRDGAWLTTLGLATQGPLTTDKTSLPVEIEGQTLRADLRDAEVFTLTRPARWVATQDGWLVVDEEEPPLRGEETDDDAEEEKEEHLHFVVAPPEGEASDTPTDTVGVFARIPHGEGFVTVGSFEMFTNSQIKHADHAGLFARLMSLPDGVRPVYVVLAPEYPGLLVWLLTRAPHALLALLLLLLACIWHVAPRFGPLQPDPVRARTGLREHLSACGAFMLRARSHEALIAPLREELEQMLAHLHHRYPDVETLPALAARISGLPLDDIHLALQPGPNTSSDFLRRSQTLALLRLHCQRLSRTTSVSGPPP